MIGVAELISRCAGEHPEESLANLPGRFAPGNLPRRWSEWSFALVSVFASAPFTAIAQPPAPPPPSTSIRQLDSVIVEANRYKPAPPLFPSYLAFLALPGPPPLRLRFDFSFSTSGATVVTPYRIPQAPTEVATTLAVIPGDTLHHAPAATLDDALRSVPGFSLVRRDDSFTAHPVAQGFSLRGLGSNGASRALLLLDGVPVNDPFGGWVAWTKLPREGIARAEVVSGGSATAWGQAALGGVVQLFTALQTSLEVVDRPPAPIAWVTTGSLRFAAAFGGCGTRSAEFALTVPTRSGVLQVLGRDFVTDGFSLVASERRGPVDIAAWSRHRWLTLRWQQPIGRKVELVATARGFEEKRGNGTPYQRNGSREKFLSLGVAGQSAEAFAWTGLAYAQSQSFASTFSAVNAARTAEIPAADLFAVPATAAGATWAGILKHGDRARTSFGADTRLVRGESREYFAFATGNFSSLRVAGGRQRNDGLFVVHQRPLNEDLRLTLGARLEQWNEMDGHRQESDRTTGILARNDRYGDRDGANFGPSAGLLWKPGRGWRLRANAQKAFRRPTLSELYRPVLAGSDITEANAALGIEKAAGADLGAEWTLFSRPPPPPANLRPGAGYKPPTPNPLLRLGATAYVIELRDAVGKVIVTRGSGSIPLSGASSPGERRSQWHNLDEVEARGLELYARWFPSKALTVSADCLFNNSTIRRAAVAPSLAGQRVAQVPRGSATLGGTWLGPAKIKLVPRVRYLGRQFEDVENQLPLGAVLVADLSVGRPVTSKLELFLAAENLGRARIETGRSIDGVVSVGTPRVLLGGLRGRW